ncbi:MAG: hypothetical protein LUG19_00610 [Desulfovibrio sp.]|uniref:hypothetical protein n=1 Tax=Desulfovibrio sp. TaxID=885 RepID=UPI00258BA6AA|nr:hypothetical protein [Desulfovibrio sp.]MCD7982738.1 hypothetical protein [Desulfovibrio sp.]
MFYKRMNDEERQRLLNAALDAEVAGDSAAAEEFLRQIPAPAELVMELKKAVGSDIMRELDLNYADAVDLYGPRWLDG